MKFFRNKWHLYLDFLFDKIILKRKWKYIYYYFTCITQIALQNQKRYCILIIPFYKLHKWKSMISYTYLIDIISCQLDKSNNYRIKFYIIGFNLIFE